MIKQKIYNLVEKGSHGSKINLLFDYFIIGLIILNVAAVALDTLTGLSEPLRIILRKFELVSIGIFTIEFILRIYVSDITHPAKSKMTSAAKFIFSPFGLIDLVSNTPLLYTIYH